MSLKKIALTSFSLFILPACAGINSLPYQPAQTPETWLQIQPYVEIKITSWSVIIVQPSTSAIVYLLGIITIGVGLFFLRTRRQQESRLWWGIALLLWGIGALLAGTSYEAFSYSLKCAGREFCIWTSWWEVLYLVLSVWSVDAMMVGMAYSSTGEKVRSLLVRYAQIHAIFYAGMVLVGALAPVKFLISFELLVLMTAPSIIAFLYINGKGYARDRDRLNLTFLGVWLGLSLTIGAYFLYFLSGLTMALWDQGIWFSENDVLHIGLILWMSYIALALAPQMKDKPLAT